MHMCMRAASPDKIARDDCQRKTARPEICIELASEASVARGCEGRADLATEATDEHDPPTAAAIATECDSETRRNTEDISGIIRDLLVVYSANATTNRARNKDAVGRASAYSRFAAPSMNDERCLSNAHSRTGIPVKSPLVPPAPGQVLVRCESRNSELHDCMHAKVSHGISDHRLIHVVRLLFFQQIRHGRARGRMLQVSIGS